MNYEFHVGDYVESKNGSIGYIVKIEKTVPYWEVTKRSDIDINIETHRMNIQYPITLENIDFGSYARIGQYDFTKKDDKIEKLDKFNDEIYPMVLKINELVDAVNELSCK